VSEDKEPIGLEELSAYLDGELDGNRRAAAERRLADDPAAAARLAEYRRRDEALRLAFNRLGEGGQPRHIYRNPPIRPRGAPGRWMLFAAVIACIGIFSAAWWDRAERSIDNRELSVLASESSAAHLRYLDGSDGATHAVGNREHPSASLSTPLGLDVKVPDLSRLGFRLTGVGDLSGPGGPAVLLVYRDGGGQQVSCYFKRLSRASETGFKQKEAAGVRIVYRLDERLGYAVVGSLRADALQQIAETVYRANANANLD
jgi:anti-sigma factor RsiW